MAMPRLRTPVAEMRDPLVLRCKHCDKLYNGYSHLAGDQTVCPDCRWKARVPFDCRDLREVNG
jgi:hypothetical protein